MTDRKLYFRTICIDAIERTIMERSLSWSQVYDFMRGTMQRAELLLDVLGMDALFVGEDTAKAGFTYRNHQGRHTFSGNGVILGVSQAGDAIDFADSRLPLSLAIRNVEFLTPGE